MAEPALEVLIVTGPLGSGKTTVVNRLLKREIAEGRKVAVLINEFGTVSVDGALVSAERPELAGITNLVNGCVCCSLKVLSSFLPPILPSLAITVLAGISPSITDRRRSRTVVIPSVSIPAC